MCVKALDYLKDMLVKAKLQFEGFDNATQPQKTHWESVRPAFPHDLLFCTMQEPCVPRQNVGKLMLYKNRLHKIVPRSYILYFGS